jgi:ATP-dependent Lon protease
VKQNGLKDGELTVDGSGDPRHHPPLHARVGVRNLERETAKICRKAVKQLLLEPETKKIAVTADNLDNSWASGASASAARRRRTASGSDTGSPGPRSAASS